MNYIIVWRNSHREPFVETTSREFLNDFSSFDEAKEFAEDAISNASEDNSHYIDYKIYEESFG